MFRSRRSVAIVPVIAAALILGACSGKPENSPVIRKKFAEVDEIKVQVNDTNQAVRSMAGDLTIIKDEISNLRAMAPDASGGSELVRRIEDIEKRLGVINSGTKTVASNDVQPTAATTDPVASLTKTGNFGELALPEPKETALAAPVKNTAPTFNGLKTTTKSSTTSTATKAPTTTKSSTSTAKAAPSTPRGRYYTIQDGDTIDKIAANNNVSVSDLRKANSLPAGARPLKGQRLFIPAK